MKGFYFSLDAILASSILLTMATMLISYPTAQEIQDQDHRLDLIHTASIQPTNKWNSSYNTSEPVLKYVKAKYYEGNDSKVEQVCQNYFKLEDKYAVYLVNSTHDHKICGDYKLSAEDNLMSRQSITPALYANNTLIAPKSALMVIRD